LGSRQFFPERTLCYIGAGRAVRQGAINEKGGPKGSNSRVKNRESDMPISSGAWAG
jgi:hypothetical protein